MVIDRKRIDKDGGAEKVSIQLRTSKLSQLLCPREQSMNGIMIIFFFLKAVSLDSAAVHIRAVWEHFSRRCTNSKLPLLITVVAAEALSKQENTKTHTQPRLSIGWAGGD